FVAGAPGSAGAAVVLPHRVEAQSDAAAVGRTDEDGDRREAVVEERHVLREVTEHLHAELRQRSAADDDDVPIDAALHERAGEHEGVDRRAAECLHVVAGGLRAAGHLGHRLRDAAAATLGTVADGLLAAAEYVLDLV